NHRAAGGGHGLAHRGVLLLLNGDVVVGGAVVPLDVVDAPRGEGHRVLHLVILGAGPMAAGLGAAVAVDAELQALVVNVVGDGLDAVGKRRRVRLQRAVGGARRQRPAVVDVHVLVAGVLHAAGHHGVGDLTDEVRVDVARELVPAVPPHRRRGGQPVD